ncbi:MAG: imelysin family protein [Cytophagaceae bacterium]|nr:imelysin family protein [Cytophagaceae bacterium]
MRLNYVLTGVGVCLLGLMAVVSSCKKSEDDPAADFDKGPLLQNVGNNIIIPNYQTLSLAVNKMDSAAMAFNAAPTVAALSDLRDFYKKAYRAWQYCSPYEFGPALTVHLRSNVNTYPASASQITSNVSSGSYNLEAAINISAKGFPALDYLLYGVAADEAGTVLKYTTDADAAKRKQYLADVSTNLKTNVTSTLNGWLPGNGNYINDFISNAGTDAGSSLSDLVNQFIIDYENLKNYKTGIPLGIQSGGTAFPEKVEAYYSGISSELALVQLKASRDLYLGKSNAGVDGVGFDDFLKQMGYSELDGNIQSQYTLAISKLEWVSDPLSYAITNTPAVVNTAYVAIQQQVTLIKRQMSTAMNVRLTFTDGDGD